MRRVLKYGVAADWEEPQALAMLEGAEIVHVGFQKDDIIVYFWAVVNGQLPPDKTEMRYFTVRMTGEEVPETERYIGTAQESGIALVLHLFEVTG